MDTRWFEDVLVLLEEGNLTRAAERRAVTQPAFSRRIRAFEDWLGQDIIDRDTNKVTIRNSVLSREADIRAFLMRLNDLHRSIRDSGRMPQRVTFATQHALTFSALPDLIGSVEAAGYPLNYRLRTANRGDCISMCIRGDADTLMCYETPDEDPLPFDASFRRHVWGDDRLVPVVGGAMRYNLTTDGDLPHGSPVILYPESSFFWGALRQHCPQWSSVQSVMRPLCESAFTAGIREMVLHGLGMAWIPMSMVWKDVESGRLVDLTRSLGFCQLTICLYSREKHYFTTNVLSRMTREQGFA
ncbi:MAG: LysR family transcriptional regulator [Rhodospirillales bacterium]